ncbi:hypothetical protein FA95DRAFT_1569019 [Auriscalpium vulgare]|uniref:Uncharacterized protein n=1 Tax=Auriscalpium vulgare TaxID=40419 RepID=A0ACB8S8N8_9AGAM|nr:hypothetical protein FA95DRAFT_1569019 [Auriscalpium vulgare]
MAASLPPNSRLITNLLADEREYHKHLMVLLDGYAGHALLSLSAYAHAFGPLPLSRSLIAVAGSLGSADDALRKYAESLGVWQAALCLLQALEDEVDHATRDRDILMVHLFKSQQLSTEGSNGGAGTSATSQIDSLQANLVASEVRLEASKRKLEETQALAIQKGLSARCKAMLDCGRTWLLMGEAGLRVLEGIHVNDPNGEQNVA